MDHSAFCNDSLNALMNFMGLAYARDIAILGMILQQMCSRDDGL